VFGEKKNRIPVSIHLLDGSVLCGQIAGGVTTDVMAALGKESAFIEFVSNGGRVKYIAKQQIVQVEPGEQLQKPELVSRSPHSDPYALLGVSADADFEAVKEAFRNLARKYHPDRFGGINLPDEMLNYTNEMFRQINNAFNMLKSEHLSRHEDDAA
jgi:hypothetical protein